MRARSFASPSAEAVLDPPRHDSEDRGHVDDAAEHRSQPEEPPDMLRRSAWRGESHLHDLRGGDAEERLDLIDQEREAEIAAAEEEPATRPCGPALADQGREIVGSEQPAADPHEPE